MKINIFQFKGEEKIKAIAFLFSAFEVATIASCLSLSNDLGIYFFYFLPVCFQLLLWLYIIDYYSPSDCVCLDQFYKTIFVISFFAIPLFFGFFFGMFHPTQSLSYEKIDNCQVIGIVPMAQASYEVYTILYVNFEYDKEQFLGYACTSDNFQNAYHSQFISSGDQIDCDDVGDSYDTIYNKRRRLLYSFHQVDDQQLDKKEGLKKKNRSLRKRGVCSTDENNNKESSYNFSDIKLSSWMCMPRNSESFEELTQPRTCYINFRNIRDRSYRNSRERVNLKEAYYFAIVEFYLPVYYPKAGLICLFIFTYLPFNLIFYPINKSIVSLLLKQFNRLYEKLEADRNFQQF